MRAVIQYELARSRIDDELRAADRRRLARAAADAKPPRDSGPTILTRVWSLFAGEPLRPASGVVDR